LRREIRQDVPESLQRQEGPLGGREVRRQEGGLGAGEGPRGPIGKLDQDIGLALMIVRAPEEREGPAG